MKIRQLVQLLSVVLTIGSVQWVRGQNCIGAVAPDFQCPDPQGSLEVYVRHETYCNRFYKCIEGKAVEGRCPAGSYFNPVENLCCPDESLCYRTQPCVAPVAGCQGCVNKFIPTGVDPSEFFICNCDGTGEGRKCPWAFDACTRTNVTLVFVNGRCQNPAAAAAASTTAVPATTTTEAPTTTTTEATTTTAVSTTTVAGETTTVAGNSTTTEVPTTTTTVATTPAKKRK